MLKSENTKSIDRLLQLESHRKVMYIFAPLHRHKVGSAELIGFPIFMFTQQSAKPWTSSKFMKGSNNSMGCNQTISNHHFEKQHPRLKRPKNYHGNHCSWRVLYHPSPRLVPAFGTCPTPLRKTSEAVAVAAAAALPVLGDTSAAQDFEVHRRCNSSVGPVATRFIRIRI